MATYYSYDAANKLLAASETPIETAEPLMIQDMENMQILTPSAPEGGGWYIWCDSDEEWYGGVPDFFDSPSVYEDGAIMSSPISVRIFPQVLYTGIYPPELVNIPAGYSVNLTFDGGQKKTVYFPHITGDDLVEWGVGWSHHGWYLPMYVATDGSTYYDEALTQLAQAAQEYGTTFEYDLNGNRTSMADETGTTNYTYDELNRLIQVDGPRANDTISYTYDQNGDRVSLITPTDTTYYEYDSLNRLIQVTSAEGRVTSYEYDLAGNRIRTTLPNGVSTYYAYDNRNRLLTLTGGPLGFTYTYDPVGNRVTLERSDGVILTYTYDELNQLTKEERTGVAKHMPPGLKELPRGFEKGKKKGFEERLPRGWEKGKKTGWPEVAVGESITTAYTYDPVGNRLSMDRNGVITNYAYDAANKLLSADGTTFEYDGNGNMVSKTTPEGTTTYTYGYENRLLSAGGVSFAYDGDGNRISKGSTHFVNDVNLPLPQVLLEQDEAGNTLASYTYGLELISMSKGESTHYYVYDGLGNVVAITDESGQTVQTYDYDAFGNVIAAEGTLENPYQFIGGYGCANDGVGLIYMRARYYMPEIGRFISRDPWWGNAYHPQSLNRYVYVENNPVNYIDPFGLLTAEQLANIVKSIVDLAQGSSGLEDLLKDAYNECLSSYKSVKNTKNCEAWSSNCGHQIECALTDGGILPGSGPLHHATMGLIEAALKKACKKEQKCRKKK